MAGLGPTLGGNSTALNVAASKVIKGTPGTIVTVNVVTAGSAAGAIYDNNSTSTGNTAATLVANIPTTATSPIELNWPCSTGITYIVGTGQVVSVAFS